ncbi:hypothetical protein K443DRAFT_84152 [Laccaria amethystina LaAM-08-1]|uniref:Uncharacterized protein n=1 Tax=Laccaria amethystina LaAM-08-1 TaxID=1095629 RepID=A0A0C9Y553_9AGAR|nr:hypothetical protein K443DRAFT_84152 [Laccaria amethystina LaAM-08-1]
MPYPHYHLAHWHRRPSRFLWFFIGAGTATWWILHKDANSYHRHGFFGHCRRPQLPPPDNGSTMNPDASWPTPDSRAVPRNVPAWGVPFEREAQWDTPDNEKMAHFSRQAVDTATELTEGALESILSTAESLKAKLVAHRAHREQQQNLYEQRQPDDQPANPSTHTV